MNLDEYKKMAEMEEYYWWHVGRKFIVEDILKKVGPSQESKILNIGCGTGGTVATLSKFGEVFNVDISDEALAFSKNRGISNLIKISDTELPFQDGTFDIVVSLDVIEHIKDDKTAMQEWLRVLKPGGTVILMAPAYQWLWSEHDELLHHHRRYTLEGLASLAPNQEIAKKSYLITFTLPLIVGYRSIKRILPTKNRKTSYVILPKFFNNVLINFLKIESKILKFFNFPFGTSALLIIKKNES